MTKNFFEKNPKKTIIIFVFVVLAFLDFITARIFTMIQSNRRNDEREIRIKSDIYNHDLAPMKSIKKAQWGSRFYPLHTNSLGFKDRAPRKIEPESSNYRLLFIGDSFTEGTGVEYEKTFIGKLDSMLSTHEVEVLNAAVISYSPSIYYRKVKDLIERRRLRFDELIVFLDISDIEDEANIYRFNQNEAVMLADRKIERPISFKIKKFLKENSMVLKSVTMLRRSRRKYRLNDHRSLWTFDKLLFEQWGKKGLEKSREQMNRLVNLLREHEIKMTIAIYPWPDQIVHNDIDSIQVKFWKKWAEENGVDFLNYFPVFITDEPFKILDNYYVRGDCHWNEKGHKLVADVFMDYFRRRQTDF